MNRARVIMTSTLLLATARFAQAGGMIASPAVYASYDQQLVTCLVRNTGTRPMSVQVSIVSESGVALTTVTDHCNNVSVAPGATCFVYATAQPGVAHACSATALSGSSKYLRGTLIVGSPDFAPRVSELR